jgi:GNAT superfamily N-acetyltransferase
MVLIKDVTSEDDARTIATWYQEEWGLPADDTLASLRGLPNGRIGFQRIVLEDGVPVATGGLYFQVAIQKRIEKYREWGPWIGLMYTVPAYRGSGRGQALLADIEEQAKARGFGTIYLFTHSAARLYQRNGWATVETLVHGDKTISVMQKSLGSG